MNILQDPKFSVVQSAKANYLIVECPDEDKMDDIALQVILEDRPPFLMPLQLRTMNDKTTISYQLTAGIALRYSLDSEISKSDFLKLANSLLTPFLTCREWFLDYHSICVDPQFIIRDKNTGSYLFVYIPEIDHENSDKDIIDFFRDTLMRVNIRDNAAFQNKIIKYLMNADFSLNELSELIKHESESVGSSRPVEETALRRPAVTPTKPAAPTPEKHNVGEKVVADKAPEAKVDQPAAHKEKAKPQKSGIFDFLLGKKKDDPFEDLMSKEESKPEENISDDLDALFSGKKKSERPEQKKNSSKGSLFSSPKPAQAKPQQSEERVKPLKKVSVDPLPPTIDNGYISEETNIGGLETRDELQLIDSKFEGAPEVIPLDFKSESAIVGRRNSESKPDIEFPETCKGVGRKHACITRTKDGGYTICDLGSSYGTLLDGKRLVPNLEYELRDGMTLVFVEQKSIRYRVVLNSGSGLF